MIRRMRWQMQTDKNNGVGKMTFSFVAEMARKINERKKTQF